jgi:hypothetical protein
MDTYTNRAQIKVRLPEESQNASTEHTRMRALGPLKGKSAVQHPVHPKLGFEHRRVSAFVQM